MPLTKRRCDLCLIQVAFHDDRALVTVKALTQRLEPEFAVKLFRGHGGLNQEGHNSSLSRGSLYFRHEKTPDTLPLRTGGYEYTPNYPAVEARSSDDLLAQDCDKHLSLAYRLPHGGGAEILLNPCDDLGSIVLSVCFPKRRHDHLTDRGSVAVRCDTYVALNGHDESLAFNSGGGQIDRA